MTHNFTYYSLGVLSDFDEFGKGVHLIRKRSFFMMFRRLGTRECDQCWAKIMLTVLSTNQYEYVLAVFRKDAYRHFQHV